jgi:hypothetical protein
MEYGHEAAVADGVNVAVWALNLLRTHGVLKVEGQKKGARWVFTDPWVHHDHQVSGE